MKRLYAAYALAVLAVFTVGSFRGWGLVPAKRGFVPASVRQSPGGYRSFSYWRGGK